MKKRVAIILAIILVLFAYASPLLAADLPDSTPTVERFNVYRNLLETGDFLLVIYANIPYTTTPDTPVTETFIWRMLDTDNVTVLGSTVGTNYNDDGYGYNVYSMYWEASEAPVWSTEYPIQLIGNPVNFDDPPEYNYQLSTSDYSLLTVTAEVKTELAARVVTIATDLNIKWSLSTAAALIFQSETGVTLSSQGEEFFRGAIYGLQALAPAAFSYNVEDIEIEDRTWETGYSENVSSQYTGTWVETAQAAGATLFGTSYDLMSVILISTLSIGIVIGNIMIHGSAWNGMIDAAFLSIIGARLALYEFGFLMVIGSVCFIYMAAKIWQIIK